MNKIYRARVVWYHYFYLILFATVTVAFFLQNQIMTGAIFSLWFIYLIESMFHTFYTVIPDGFLLIYKGKFKKSKVIKIDEIEGVTVTTLFKWKKIESARLILFKYQNEYYSLYPKEFDELLNILTKI